MKLLITFDREHILFHNDIKYQIELQNNENIDSMYKTFIQNHLVDQHHHQGIHLHLFLQKHLQFFYWLCSYFFFFFFFSASTVISFDSSESPFFVAVTSVK